MQNIDLPATQAREIADQVNAPDIEKALEKALKSVGSAARKGLYSDWVLLREIDSKGVCEALTALGYEAMPLDADEEGKTLVKINWGLA